MRHSSIRSVYAYWNHLRAHRPAPFRTEVDPRALARELGDLFLLEGERGDMQFRLAGSRIVQALGDSLTGRRFALLWEDGAKAGAEEAIATVLEAEEPMLLGIRLSEPEIRPEPSPTPPPPSRPAPWLNLRPLPGPRIERRAPLGLAGELLLLPLRHPAGSGRRIFGAMALFAPPAIPRTTPARLVISGGRMLGRDALPLRGFDLVPGGVERRAHLLVLKGDRDN
ncbi:PAS domain-containing protein [Rhabdaerophilum sp. SD176]|uniref:PAS domain-containing protein n=1 Tax=Rhabdaerophilum sp. SD176 TaxID=2983548 RepID=UPI0024DF91DF|nr:PAS domain-containing protein [Rhabdaerophilum sp. SD176]